MFGKAKEYFNRIINGFQDIGYTAVGKSLNAADYGTPQARERCFFVAVRNDILAKTKLKNLFEHYGPVRYATVMLFGLTMFALPIKMYLRWMFNLKYIIAIPEWFFNI